MSSSKEGVVLAKNCPYCEGSGKCRRCKGYGKIVGVLGDVECGPCKGTGKCPACDGTGEILR